MTAPSPLRSPAAYGTGFWVKLALLAFVDAMGIYALANLVSVQAWGFVAALVVGLLIINIVYLSRRTKASKWLTPGMLLMAVFVVWPILFSLYISLTNWATGNILTKDQAVENLESQVVRVSEDEAVEYDLVVFRDPAGELRFWIEPDSGAVIFGTPRDRTAPIDEAATEDPGALGIVDDDGDGVPEAVGGFVRLELRDLFGIANELENLVLDLPGGGEVQALTVSSARLIGSSQRYVYDAATDVLTDTTTGVACVPERGNFICDGTRLDPGWRVVIGFDNFTDVVSDERLRGPLVRVFTWNVVFAFLSVVLTLAVGLGLAMTLDADRLRGRAIYRSILVLPYAMPAFISALVWRGMFNDTFGQVNRVIEAIGFDGLPWLLDGTWAKVAVLVVNTWLGFPYMFLICAGALQSIPSDLKEAARVDGANPLRVFRTVTFPLLMVSIAPLLIGSFAYNFNNFVLIFLLTGGGPPILGSAVPVGETDILISFTFDVAVQSGRGNNFGLGSTLTILIFLLVAMISALSFRYTRRLEDVYA